MLQPLRYLRDCSDCFRLERLPGGACTHWKAPPFHGARQKQTFGLERFPFRRTISRIREVCSAFRSRDLIKTRGDRLAEAPDGERGILQSICGNFAQERLEFGE